MIVFLLYFSCIKKPTFWQGRAQEFLLKMFQSMKHNKRVPECKKKYVPFVTSGQLYSETETNEGGKM